MTITLTQPSEALSRAENPRRCLSGPVAQAQPVSSPLWRVRTVSATQAGLKSTSAPTSRSGVAGLAQDLCEPLQPTPSFRAAGTQILQFFQHGTAEGTYPATVGHRSGQGSATGCTNRNRPAHDQTTSRASTGAQPTRVDRGSHGPIAAFGPIAVERLKRPNPASGPADNRRWSLQSKIAASRFFREFRQLTLVNSLLNPILGVLRRRANAIDWSSVAWIAVAAFSGEFPERGRQTEVSLSFVAVAARLTT